MFKARPAGPVSAADQDARPFGVSPRQGRRDPTGRGFATGAGLLARVLAIAVNWGIAAFVYLFVAVLIARLLGRAHR